MAWPGSKEELLAKMGGAPAKKPPAGPTKGARAAQQLLAGGRGQVLTGLQLPPGGILKNGRSLVPGGPGL